MSPLSQWDTRRSPISLRISCSSAGQLNHSNIHCYFCVQPGAWVEALNSLYFFTVDNFDILNKVMVAFKKLYPALYNIQKSLCMGQ